MKPSEKIRRSAFWFVDWLKGSHIRRHYKDIKFIHENPNTQEAVRRRNSYLLKILQHATKTTSFYSKFRNFITIEDFSVINKTTIKENPDRFLSSAYKTFKTQKVTTSGSTGAPLTVWQDTDKRARHKAENIYFSELAGFQQGSRLYYLRVWNEINRKNLFKRLQQNIIMEDAADLSDNTFKNLVEKLKKDTSSKSILAFSSTYEAISHYVRAQHHPLPVKVSCLITISETLPEGAKEILKKAFNCPVVSRYSNMENGFLAQQCIEENNEYHINEVSFHIELLEPDRDEPVAAGSVGRVVVTDLFNYAMPLIRYDTGDMAIMAEKSACGKPGPVFTKVEGRKVDFICDTRGNLLSPHVVTNTMWKYSSEIRQFQFIQNGLKDYLIKLNCLNASFKRPTQLIEDLRHYLGEDAQIEIEYVDEIALLASGKRKKIINNYNKL